MATKSDKVEEFQFKSVPNETKWESFQKALYDPDKQEFFGRTKKSWYQLLIFYSIFYACLAVLCALCMQGLLATLSDKEPKFKLGESLIGTNPGLGFRPISKATEKGSLIWYNLEDFETTKEWSDLIDEFLTPYNVEQVGKNYQDCSEDVPVEEGKVCTVKLRDFGPCVKDNNYMYNSTSPCVFLKLNKIFGWVPEFKTTIEEGMPEDVKDLVQSGSATNTSKIWISCQGEKPVDRERIGGFNYFPSQGFPGYYFPYTNTENYLSPLVAVQVLNVHPTTVVNIECRAWANNINYSGSNVEREGSVHFEILVDAKS